MVNVVTKIIVKAKAQKEVLTDEFLEEYKEGVYEFVKNETDDDAEIEVFIEVGEDEE